MRKILSLALVLLMAAGLAAPATASSLPGDYQAVMAGINLTTPQTLTISKPSGNISTTASSYYLTGSSDPSQPLYMNGYEITTRGQKGSWGVFVNLSYGGNQCTFTQGNTTKTVIITRDQTGAYSTTKTLSSMYPTSDMVVRAGDTVKITAIGPAGGSIWATIGGTTIQLKQNVAAAVAGVPANFSGEITMGAASGISNIGRVSYTLSFNGSTTAHTSVGDVYLAAQGYPVVVQVTDTVVNLFEKDSAYSNFVSVLDFGMVDTVTEIGDLYKLSMGGWVPKSGVAIRPNMSADHNTVSSVRFNKTEKEEQYILQGTTFPGYTSHQSGDVFYISFADTSGISSVPVGESALFSACEVTQKSDGYTVLAFTLKPGTTLWGYLVEYKDGGVIQISMRYKPTLYSGDRPLAGTVVCIDPGHGGGDGGALGMPNGANSAPAGPNEAAINLAHGLALKNKLELLGAKVIMVRTTDVNSTMNSRVMLAQQNRADFYISLHSNAIAGNGIGKGGTEVYYYEDFSGVFASTVASKVAAATGRTNRGGKFSNYKVTLGSFGPSVLVEMGFVSNPVEYDQMIDNWYIYQTATAISDAIIEQLK